MRFFGVCFPGPGLAPAGDLLFLRVQEKEAKEARPCCPYPLRCAAGQPAVLARGALPRNSLRATRCVQTDAASQSTKRVCPAAHAPAPCPALLGFASARLSDEDLSLDFATCTTPSDRVAVIATAPLTCNEQWTAFASGELLVFQDGQRCCA